MTRHRNQPRHRAAAQVLDEIDHLEPGAVAVGPEESARADELGAMRTLAALLAELPAEAWPPLPASARNLVLSPAHRHHRGRLRRSYALGIAFAFACLAIGFGLGAMISGAHGPASTGRPRVAVITLRPLPGQAAAASARVEVTPAGQIVISVRRLPRAGAGRFYEAWLMTSATRLVPVASFRPDARGGALVQTSLPAPAGAYRYIDVSLQRSGAGSAHSGDSVLRGPAAPLAQPPS